MLALLFCVLVVGNPAAVAAADWAGAAFGQDARRPSPGGPLRIEDLITLRDIGPISISPDGRWLAFSVRQPILDEDRYAVRWFAAPVDGGSPPRALADHAGEPLIDYMYGLPYASISPERAKWSPDGQRLAYRRRIGDHVGLVVGDRASGAVNEVADGAVNVSDFAWLPSGLLAFRTGLDVAAHHDAVALEARSGWLLDGRMPLFAARAPAPTRPDCRTTAAPPCRNDVHVAEAEGPRPASAAEIAAFEAQLAPEAPAPARPGAGVRIVSAPRSDGRLAWAETVDPAARGATTPLLQVVLRSSKPVRCELSACRGAFIRAVGLTRPGDRVWFVKSVSGSGRGDDLPRDETAVYTWRPGSLEAQKVYQGDALLEGCASAGSRLICAMEEPTVPRRIIALDLDTGRLDEVADPNPDFREKALPRVRKIYLADAKGRAAFAHVVYPYGFQEGRKYPLVVTQYDSRGFLRGQVGDAHAIFDLAAHGFFVLSVDRPEDWDGLRTLDTLQVYQRGLGPGLPDRESAMQANEAAVDLLIAEGLVDPTKVGLTGVSAGAENVHFTLQHSDRYAAAIADSGSHDMTFLALVPPGDRRSTLQKMFSMKDLSPRPGDALLELAWSNRPERLRTPLLISAGANQSMVGFEGVQALAAAGRPVEMRIFPEEMHILYRPQNIVALQELNRSWLEFWLQGREDMRGAGPGQFDRWRTMRARQAAERSPVAARSSHQSKAGW